jgi:uncharacterized membrane protein
LLKKKIKSIFLTGLVVVIPAGLTLYIVVFLVKLMDQLLLFIPDPLQPAALLGVHIPGFGIITTLLLIFTLGLITRSYFGGKILLLSERLLDQIPIVRSIYQALKLLLTSIVRDRESSFRQVVLVQFPRPGVYSLGFVTKGNIELVEAGTGKKTTCVFVPTTPNPTTGFFMMVPEEEIIHTAITIEEAMMMIMSMGIVSPGTLPHNGKNKAAGAGTSGAFPDFSRNQAEFHDKQ